MQQKMKWIDYLQLGISLVFVLLFSSCKKTITSKADWLYINDTEHHIYIAEEGDTLHIPPLKQEFIHKPLVFKDVEITGFRPPLIYSVKYDSMRCDDLIANQGILDINNYEAEELGDNYYQYTYRITEADYERAINCE